TGFVGEQRDTIRSGIEDRVGKTNEAQQALERAFVEFLQTGNTAALEGHARPEELAQFNTWTRQRLEQAKAEEQEILNKYESSKDSPVAELDLFGEGAERWLIPIGAKKYDLMALTRGEQVVDGMSREESMRLGQRLATRQTELDLNFSPIRALRQN